MITICKMGSAFPQEKGDRIHQSLVVKAGFVEMVLLFLVRMNMIQDIERNISSTSLRMLLEQGI